MVNNQENRELTNVVNEERDIVYYGTRIYNIIRDSVAYTARSLRDDLSLKLAVVGGLIHNPQTIKLIEYIYSNYFQIQIDSTNFFNKAYMTSAALAFLVYAISLVGGRREDDNNERKGIPYSANTWRNTTITVGTLSAVWGGYSLSIPILGGGVVLDNLKRLGRRDKQPKPLDEKVLNNSN